MVRRRRWCAAIGTTGALPGMGVGACFVVPEGVSIRLRASIRRYEDLWGESRAG